ncbi:MAG: NAD(P)/FAD-dependent oxidoreductase [Acuticoccus sp.]
MLKKPEHVVVIGAGPAGLMAAHELSQAGVAVTLLERRKVSGGLGGTVAFESRHGTFRFDFGGHRFITHNAALLKLVEDLVGDDLLYAERRSVIRLGGRTYDYPLAPANLLANAPPAMLAGAACDLGVRMLPWHRQTPGDDFASWTRARFGPTLYRTFFEGYTRKLWGVEPTELSGDWAQQRISLVDLKDVARRLVPGKRSNVRTYARTYRYPRLGFGVIFDRLVTRLVARGVRLCHGAEVVRLGERGGRITEVVTGEGPIACDAVVSTVPLPDMVRLTGGQSRLSFRGLRFFNMVMARENISPWTWQYLSDPDILATRLQEPRRRSPEMAPPGMTSMMLEIPCDPGEALWEMDDDALFARVCPDLVRLGIDPAAATGEYFSARTATAYPLMVCGYQVEREAAFAHLSRYSNLVQCGRLGTFRYVFTDTAMEMGMMAAASVLGGAVAPAAIHAHRNEPTVLEIQSVA